MIARTEQVKLDRLEARVKPEVKQAITRAAAALGVSVTDFLVTAAFERAVQTLSAYQQIALSDRDYDALVEALMNPPTPNDALLAAARQSREIFGE